MVLLKTFKVTLLSVLITTQKIHRTLNIVMIPKPLNGRLAKTINSKAVASSAMDFVEEHRGYCKNTSNKVHNPGGVILRCHRTHLSTHRKETTNNQQAQVEPIQRGWRTESPEDRRSWKDANDAERRPAKTSRPLSCWRLGPQSDSSPLKGFPQSLPAARDPREQWRPPRAASGARRSVPRPLPVSYSARQTYGGEAARSCCVESRQPHPRDTFFWGLRKTLQSLEMFHICNTFHCC